MSYTSRTEPWQDIDYEKEREIYNYDRYKKIYNYISSWWSIQHDSLLKLLIDQYQWYFNWHISEEVEKSLPENVLVSLRNFKAWYNRVMYFGISRAVKLGYTKKIREPKTKKCPLCHHNFLESAIPHSLAYRLGMDNLDYCPLCLKELLLRNTGNADSSPEEVLEYLNNLVNIINVIPHDSYGEYRNDLLGLSKKDIYNLLKLFQNKPSRDRILKLFGTWNNALVKADILEDIRYSSRGIVTKALDGHLCRSLGEKTIDDFLYNHGIEHERDFPYPVGGYTVDFKTRRYFIEYFGLVGDVDYDLKSKRKEKICRDNGIKLIKIFPEDLVNIAKLADKLSVGLN